MEKLKEYFNTYKFHLLAGTIGFFIGWILKNRMKSGVRSSYRRASTAVRSRWGK